MVGHMLGNYFQCWNTSNTMVIARAMAVYWQNKGQKSITMAFQIFWRLLVLLISQRHLWCHTVISPFLLKLKRKIFCITKLPFFRDYFFRLWHYITWVYFTILHRVEMLNCLLARISVSWPIQILHSLSHMDQNVKMTAFAAPPHTWAFCFALPCSSASRQNM